MDTTKDDDLKSYFAAALAALTGSPSRRPLLEKNSNVIIPSTGAAKYWYVDPKAANVPMSGRTASFNPMAYAVPQRFDDRPYRNLGPNVNQRTAVEMARGQDRPNGYADMMQTVPGIVEAPTMDLEGGERTGTYEIDGKFYVLPTQVNGVPFNGSAAVDRFRRTGEHLGVFNAEDNANIFEKTHLPGGTAYDQKNFQLLPPNSPFILMNRKLPRFAGERDDLLKDIDNAIYNGGNAPAPTPTPTPTSPRYFPISYFA